MLYKLERENPERSERVEIRNPAHFGLKEKDIEDFLKSRLAEIVSEDHLMLIGQERSRQEEADLLALDKKGTLYIFELKRWESNSENILQVMRYGQIFGRYSYGELGDLAKRQQKLEGSLKEKHKEYFVLEKVLEESQFNQDQVFVLVTNGIDADTISAVDFWSRKCIRIECCPYRIYDIGGTPYIQFDTFNPDGKVIPEENTQYFVVNTNKTYMENAWMDMLGNLKIGKASAYYDRKHSICIPQGSVVYLYHTQTGVIAKGITTATHKKTNYDGDEDAEFYVPLDYDWALEEKEWARKAPAAWEINKKLNTSHRFRQTVFMITKSMAEAIDSIATEKREKKIPSAG